MTTSLGRYMEAQRKAREMEQAARVIEGVVCRYGPQLGEGDIWLLRAATDLLEGMAHLQRVFAVGFLNEQSDSDK